MKVNSRIELEFAGITLPVGKDVEGHDIVPLKPISDVFGLSWSDMKKRFGEIGETCGGEPPTAGEEKQADLEPHVPSHEKEKKYISRRLGACLATVPFAGQRRKMLCIRLDRVSTYINSEIDVDRVRAAGNEIGADFLEAKHEEWDGVIHEYETRQGGMIQSISGETRTKAINIRLYLSVLRAKRDTNDEADRIALTTMAKALAADAGAPYQGDLIDGQKQPT